MLETVLKHNQRDRWAVQLRLKPLTFSWAVLKAGERRQPVSTYINARLEELARADLQKGISDGDLHLAAE